MKISEMLVRASGRNEDFIVGKDRFEDLSINPTTNGTFYYFFHKPTRRLIKHFVLAQRERVDYLCQVALIKNGEKFSPRLCISVRDKARNIINSSTADEQATQHLKANVDLKECHTAFWELISFLQSLRDLEIPAGSFSLVTQGDAEIVSALRGRDPASIVSIIKELSTTEGLKFGKDDLNELLKRREKLALFEAGLAKPEDDESVWQNFFEKNKWIFGYGLNYQILRQEQPQPTYGGVRHDGKGAQRGDYLTSTAGNLSFTVLVEIKTPSTPLLTGSKEIRNGAWSLAKELTDALTQIEANIDTWNKEGSQQIANRDLLEGRGVYTVQPKGIIVIGHLGQFGEDRNKRNTFERFRKSLHGIDILTFDELYERAKFIVEARDIL